MHPHHPVRTHQPHYLLVPTTDHRTHPSTPNGSGHIVGGGMTHHDVVNIPFYGRIYDTAVIRHPLSVSDRYQDPRMRLIHVNYLMDMLKDIQESARSDPRTTIPEWRARQDSLGVLGAVRKHWRSGVQREREQEEDGDEDGKELADLVPDDEDDSDPEEGGDAMAANEGVDMEANAEVAIVDDDSIESDAALTIEAAKEGGPEVACADGPKLNMVPYGYVTVEVMRRRLLLMPQSFVR